MNDSHDSYGLLHIGNVQINQSTRFFGSLVAGTNAVELTIYQACKDDSGMIQPKQRLFQVRMSQIQFAKAITMPNVGWGIPCSIVFNGEQVEQKVDRLPIP